MFALLAFFAGTLCGAGIALSVVAIVEGKDDRRGA